MLHRPGEWVVEVHLATRRSDDLGDACSHLPGADDENPFEAHRRSVTPGSRRFTFRIE